MTKAETVQQMFKQKITAHIRLMGAWHFWLEDGRHVIAHDDGNFEVS